MKKLFATRLFLDGLGRFVMMLVVIFLSRRLGVEQFGQLAYGLSIVNISYFFCDFGVATLFLREMGRANEVERAQVWEKFFGLKVVLATVIVLIGSLLSFKLWHWANPGILIALYLSMIGNCFLDFFNYACNALQDLKSSAIMMLLHKGFVILMVFLVCLGAPTLDRVSYALAVGSLIGLALSLVVVRRRLFLPLKIEWRPSEWGGWLKETFPLAVANIVIIAYGRFGILLLPYLQGETATGFYAAAHRIFEAGYILPAALVGVLLPRLAKSHSQSAVIFGEDLKKVFKYMLGLMVAWLVVLEPLSYWVIRLLFGEAYLPAVPALRVLLIVNALVMFNVLLSQIMIVLNHLKWHAANGVITALAALVFTYMGVKHHGGVGAAAALLAAEMVFTGLTVFALWRLRYNEALRARSSVG